MTRNQLLLMTATGFWLGFSIGQLQRRQKMHLDILRSVDATLENVVGWINTYEEAQVAEAFVEIIEANFEEGPDDGRD